MPATQPRRPVTALLDAAEGLVEAGQQVILDRIDLVRLEATEEIRQVVVVAARVAAAVVLATLGWVFVTSGITVALADVVHPGLAAILVGAPHVIAGIVIAVATVRALSKNEPTRWVPPLDAEPTDA